MGAPVSRTIPESMELNKVEQPKSPQFHFPFLEKLHTRTAAFLVYSCIMALFSAIGE